MTSPALPVSQLSVSDIVSGSLRLYRQYRQDYAAITKCKPLDKPRRFALYNRYAKQRRETMFVRYLLSELFGQPESLESVQAAVEPRLKLLARTQQQLWGYGMAIYISCSWLMILLNALLASISTSISTTLPNAPMLIVALQLVLMLLSGPLVLLLFWLTGLRFSVSTAVVAWENDFQNANQVWQRCRNLTQRSTWRIWVITMLSSFVTMPLRSLGWLPALLLSVWLTAQGQQYILPFILFLYLLVWIVVSSWLFVPLKLILRALIYYDLRVRREGMDLRLPERG